jgi:hypothetical protein
MASEGSKLAKLLGTPLREMYRGTVDEPLPAIIQQTIRRLRQRDKEAAETAAKEKALKPIKWDLIVPGTRSGIPRS